MSFADQLRSKTHTQSEPIENTKMKTQKRNWSKAPARGCTNPASELYRYTVVRLRDKAERFTDRLPRIEIRKSLDFMVWDNRENTETTERTRP